MRGAHTILLTITAMVGCDTMNKMQVDNPVMPDAPPRMQVAKSAQHAAETAPDTDIVQMTYTPAEAGSSELVGSRVVATVNGSPVFESDILDRYRPQLMAARQQMSDIEFGKLKLALLERDLGVHLENQLLVRAMLSTLSPEQHEMLEEQLQGAFNDHIADMAAQMGVTTQLEVERELQKRGGSIELIRKEFANQALAVEYLRAKAEVKEGVERSELLAYYREHLKDYAREAEVKWMQLSVSFRKHGSKAAADAHMQKAIAELQQGQEFAEVAKKYSDGPTAAEGGMRDWLKKGSLADEDIENTLFSMQSGQMSQVFTGKSRLQVVKVIESKPARHVPFEEVQLDIEETIKSDRRTDAFKKVIEELRDTSSVVTIFDADQNSATGGDVVPAS